MDFTSSKRRALALPKISNVFQYVLPIHLGIFLVCLAALCAITLGALKVHTLQLTSEPTVSAESLKQPTTTDSQPVSPTPQVEDNEPLTAPSTTSIRVTTPTEPTCNKVATIQPSGAHLQQPGFTQLIEAPRYYPIYGQSIDQIRRQLSQCGPNGYFASTNYRLNWLYSTQVLSSGECQLTNVRIGMHVIVQYPAWQTSQSADAATQQRWNAMMQNLVAHEEGHVSRNITIAKELTSTLQNLPPTACSSIVAQVQSITSQYTLKLQSAHGTYDSATNHGETQGAWL